MSMCWAAGLVILCNVPSQKPRSAKASELKDPAFRGFSAWVFKWFAGLERDNSRAYFNATRDRYESGVRDALTLMLRELSATFGGRVRVFRQQNDMRFAPASPYKTRTYGVLESTSPAKARRYADVSSRGLYSGSGYRRLVSDQLSRYRAAVVDDALGGRLIEAQTTALEAGLELIGDSLGSVPRGYPRDHPRAELLKHRSLLAGRLIPGDSGISREAALNHVAGSWHAAAPLTAWLDEHVGPSTLAPRERWPRRSAKPAETAG
ncbi:MAG TPA: DUF2461 family protein [Candidatus Dormibacteraeota bacterium]